jgi:hypothetical protein
MKEFSLQIGNLKYSPDNFAFEQVVCFLKQVEGIGYRLLCRGSKNNYQLISDFDSVVEHKLIEFGGRRFSLSPSCSANIDFDFALQLGTIKCVFEMEKTNKEKLLYDFLKMHVYLDSGADVAILLVPVNWAHSSGVIDLFSVAANRFSLCRQYGMLNKEKAHRMLLLGFTQIINGSPLTDNTLRSMKADCRRYFQAKNRVKPIVFSDLVGCVLLHPPYVVIPFFSGRRSG